MVLESVRGAERSTAATGETAKPVARRIRPQVNSQERRPRLETVRVRHFRLRHARRTLQPQTHWRDDLGRSPRVRGSHRSRRHAGAVNPSLAVPAPDAPATPARITIADASQHLPHQPRERADRPRDAPQVSDVHETVDGICRQSRLRDDRPVHAGRCRPVLRGTEARAAHEGDPPRRAARFLPLRRQPEMDARNAGQLRHQTSGRLQQERRQDAVQR